MKKVLLTAFSSLILAAAVSPVLAQKTSTGQGLDALDEQRLMNELVDEGLQTLLKREFDVNHTPQDQRNGVLARIAMQKLSDPAVKMTSQEREDLLNEVVQGIAQALPTMKDPTALMQTAKVLVTAGVEPDINTLEYWGPDPKKQAHAKPLVDTVIQVYTKAQAEAQRVADDLANHMTPNDDAAAKRWEAADNLHTLAGFSLNMLKYDQCLTLDKADPNREKIADDAITYLKQYDTNDSGVQAAVRNRIAKLNMAKGDYDQAEKTFATVITDDPKAPIKPEPTKAQQYEARYFSIVCQILDGKFDDAQKTAETLKDWQAANLDAVQQKGASAAFAMLQYRILSGQADKATDPAKQQLNDKAIAVLMQLVKDEPQYKATVFEQVMTRLPANPDLTKLDPLLLLALQQQGLDEFFKPENAAIDQKVMDRAIAAAREIVKRKGQPGMDVATVAKSAYTIPYLLEREKKPKEAAAAFLDYAQQFPTPLKESNDALDHATVLIAELRKADLQDQDTRKLYDRFLPLAIKPPFDRKQFAFEYALLLQREQHYKEAVEYFKQVAPDDKRILSARFYEMVALKQRLNDDSDKMEPAERQDVMSQVQQLADQVNTEAAADEAKATTNDEKKRYASMLVRTALLAADLAAREQKNPQRALDLLNGFENRIKGMDNEQQLLVEALTLRVSAYMDIGRTNDATASLVKLISLGKDKTTGPAMVFDLLQKLSAEMDHARAINDTKQVAQIAQNRAVLTGFLVTWSENNPDPEIKKLAPKYRAADAKTKFNAAELTTDPAARKTALEAALKQYQALDDPRNPDPRIKLGLGQVQFALGNYKAAQDALSPLVLNKQVGGPTTTVDNNGQPEVVDNPVYWETNYDLLRSIVEVAKQNPKDADAQKSLAQAKTYLKQLFVERPKTIGGKKFHAEFEKLRAEIVPDFHPENLTEPTTEPAPVAEQ